MKTELDLTNWNRIHHFNFFKGFDNPFYNICSNIEVTELYKVCKNNKPSFFYASLFLSIKAVNELKEFRSRIEGDKVYIYDRIHPFSTVINDDNTFNFCEFYYVDKYAKFHESSDDFVEAIKNNRELDPKPRLDVIHYTVIPWISLTSISHARNYGTSDSIPKIVFGKYFEEYGKLMMPVSVDVHHSLVDGFHVGQFLQKFRENIINSSTLISI